MPSAARYADQVARHKSKEPTYESLPLEIRKALLGRPSGYKEEFCDRVVELACEGYSLLGFCGMIGVSRQTVNDWLSKHPNFAEACARAAAGRLWFWETKLIHVANTGGSGSQGTVAMFGAVNAARTAESILANPWVHKAEIEHSGSVTLASVVERMFAKLEAIEASRKAEPLIIDHIQEPSEQSSFDIFGGMDT